MQEPFQNAYLFVQFQAYQSNYQWKHFLGHSTVEQHCLGPMPGTSTS